MLVGGVAAASSQAGSLCGEEEKVRQRRRQRRLHRGPAGVPRGFVVLFAFAFFSRVGGISASCRLAAAKQTTTPAGAATWEQELYAKASNTGDNDRFGRSVSLSGNRVAVGSWFEDSCATGVNNPDEGDGCNQAGAVYVFERDPTTGNWSQMAYLKASNAGGNDDFGSAVSLDGDRLAVGAVGEASCGGGEGDDACFDAGAVYVFAWNATSGNWSQTAYVKASNAKEGANFGNSLSLDGDRLAVGAWLENSCTGGDAQNTSCPGAGAAYVFDFNATARAWTHVGYLKANEPDAGDLFGYSVSLDGNRAAVGAYFEAGCSPVHETDDGCPAAGAVYIFELNATAGAWEQVAYLKTSNSEPDDRIGSDVSLEGDRLAVGASGEASCFPVAAAAQNQTDNGCPGAGAAYVFERSTTTGGWSQTAYLKASNPGFANEFGLAVSLDGGLLAIAAKSENGCSPGINGNETSDGCNNAGATYIFELLPPGAGGSWVQTTYAKASNPGINDDFGYSVSLDGGRLAVGAWREDSCGTGVNNEASQSDNGCTRAGAAYVLAATAPEPQATTGTTGSTASGGTTTAAASLTTGAATVTITTTASVSIAPTTGVSAPEASGAIAEGDTFPLVPLLLAVGALVGLALIAGLVWLAVLRRRASVGSSVSIPASVSESAPAAELDEGNLGYGTVAAVRQGDGDNQSYGTVATVRDDDDDQGDGSHMRYGTVATVREDDQDSNAKYGSVPPARAEGLEETPLGADYANVPRDDSGRNDDTVEQTPLGPDYANVPRG